MAMESSIFPVPSEVVIPPAAFLAARRGHLDLPASCSREHSVLIWVPRSPIGFRAALGRPLIMRYGKYFLRRGRTNWNVPKFGWRRYEAGGVFFARLLPVIRHLISIPAGIVRMNFWMFSMVTIVGLGDLVRRSGVSGQQSVSQLTPDLICRIRRR